MGGLRRIWVLMFLLVIAVATFGADIFMRISFVEPEQFSSPAMYMPVLRKSRVVRPFAGVYCNADTDEEKIQCGMFPLKQGLVALLTGSVAYPTLARLTRSAVIAGAAEVDAFRYDPASVIQMDNAAPRNVPFFESQGNLLLLSRPYIPAIDAALEPLYQVLRAQQERMKKTDNRVFELLLRRVREIALAAAANTIDPYTFYTPVGGQNRVLPIPFRLSGGDVYLGTGLIFGAYTHVYVKAIIPGTIAAFSGLQPYDEILDINGYQVGSASDAELLMFNALWPFVTIHARRNGADMYVTMPKQAVMHPSAIGMLIRVGDMATCHLIINSVTISIESEVAHIVTGICRDADTLILDLRDNHGGYVSPAAKVANMLLSAQVKNDTVLFSIRGRGIEHAHRSYFSPLRRQWKAPIVILQNNETASAAEILIGALRTHAVLVGDRTFGKHSGWNNFFLADGSQLHMTMIKIVFPDIDPATLHGFIPDVYVPVRMFRVLPETNFLLHEEHMPGYRGLMPEVSVSQYVVSFLGRYDPELAIAFNMLEYTRGHKR